VKKTTIVTVLLMLLGCGLTYIAHSEAKLQQVRGAASVRSTEEEVDVLVKHIRVVITDETNQVEPKKLRAFVRKYQDKALAAGVDDINSQTQYVLLALYTSGAGVEHPACRALMAKPPKKFDDYYKAMQALPDSIWDTGKPIWNDY
jgi:hypothetical protein